MRAALLGLVINLALGIIKSVGGLIANSYALLSDAINSLGDCFASVVVLVALAYAQRPADKDHPYGHARAEAVASSSVALLIIVSALWLGWNVLWRTPVQHEVPPLWTLWIAGGNVIIKEALYRYKVRIGRRIKSSAIIANAWDHRSDALCSLAVLVGLLVVRLGGPRFVAADEIAALVVVIAIVWSGVTLFGKSLYELMDVEADSELRDAVRSAAEQVDGVRAVETLRLRKSGLEYFADIHIEVDATLTVAHGHSIGHRVKDTLLEKFPSMMDVLVHLEPYAPPNAKNHDSHGDRE
ncbi:MAG: cation transporter [Pirellulales bacterium]|nr:cation transporter [Pirellulales bacterium]